MFEGWYDPCPYNPEYDYTVWPRKQNGLNPDWQDKTYVNPPYSQPLPWVEKAIKHSKEGKRIVMLLKADTSTKVFKLLHEHGADIFWCAKRLKYGVKGPAMFPSMLVFL